MGMVTPDTETLPRRGAHAGFAVAVLIGAALVLAGCGVRGSLENPANAGAKASAPADSGQGKKEGEAPKPHKDFILDGLIR